MLPAVKQFFEKNLLLDTSPQTGDREKELHLAAAALLLEVGDSDFQLNEDERRSICDALTSEFDLSQQEVKGLVDLARQEAQDATCLHGFTSLINDHWPLQRKVQLMEKMWTVAFSDRVIDSHEHHLLRKVASLLYIPHKEYIAARFRAKQLLGL